MSLLLMCQFCDMMGVSYTFYVNDNRYHGFSLPMHKVRGYLVIASDFSISEGEMIALRDNDTVVLSTDHHEIQDTFIENEIGVVISNQYKFEPEEDRYLSGAGVFFELICSLYPEFDTPERRGIVGITLLSDIRDLNSKKARAYLKKTYTMDATMGYAKYLVEELTKDKSYGFGAPKIERNFIDFTLSPCINALLRANKTSLAVNFILGAGLPPTNAKELQKRVISALEEKALVLVRENCHFILANTSDFTALPVDISGYIGLYCSYYKDRHKNVSTLGFVVDNGAVKRASFRGRCDGVNYRATFRMYDIKAEGHAGAFGIKDFTYDKDTFQTISDFIGDLEADYKPEYKIVSVPNLSVWMTQHGLNTATENCYVQDSYRTYLRYTGKNISIRTITYLTEECEKGEKPEIKSTGRGYKYVRDSKGEKIPKYIEYMIDGRAVKSFGDPIEGNVILPMLDKNYVVMYVHNALE